MKNEAKVGIIVIGAIVIFVATFLSVATIQLRGEKIAYRTYFKFAGGLDDGDLVRYGGRKAGVIRDVRPFEQDPTVTEVLFELREDVPVNEESVATISSLSALGDNYMEITPGSIAAPRIPPDGVVPSKEPVAFSDITAKIDEVASTAQLLLGDVREDITLLTDDLRAVLANVQELTGQRNQQNVERLLTNANRLFEEQTPKIDRITTQVSELLDRMPPILEEVEEVASSANRTVDNIDQTVTDVREPLKRDLAELETAIVEARGMLEDVRALVSVNQADINEAIENFRIVSENLEQFSDEIRQRPWSLIRVRAKEDRQVPVGAGN